MTLISFDDLIVIASDLLDAADQQIALGLGRQGQAANPTLAAQSIQKAACVLGAIELWREAGHTLFDSEQGAFEAELKRCRAWIPMMHRR